MAECGCTFTSQTVYVEVEQDTEGRVVYGDVVYGNVTIRYCPLHGAAPRLLEALEALNLGTAFVDGSRIILSGVSTDAVAEACAAIDAARGKGG